jgi:uncharacterized protein
MGEQNTRLHGAITWADLTVEDAPALRDFYSAVVGWSAEAVNMGTYSDFSMNLPDGGTPVAGICHARGMNEGLPAQWLVYITVRDLDLSLARCEELGGSVLTPPRSIGQAGRFSVIRDPAGAVAALFEPASQPEHP